MTILLVRGDERVEIAGSDALIQDSVSYSSVFQTQVERVLEKFYAGTRQEASSGH